MIQRSRNQLMRPVIQRKRRRRERLVAKNEEEDPA